jgi:hypothetical protein
VFEIARDTLLRLDGDDAACSFVLRVGGKVQNVGGSIKHFICGCCCVY